MPQENREFGSSFSKIGKTGNLTKAIRNMFLHMELASNTGEVLNSCKSSHMAIIVCLW